MRRTKRQQKTKKEKTAKEIYTTGTNMPGFVLF